MPPPMNVPSATSGMRSFASSATMTKSHERASSQPAPLRQRLKCAEHALARLDVGAAFGDRRLVIAVGLEVGPGAEPPSRPRHDDDARLEVRPDAPEFGLQRLVHGEAHGVETVGTVEAEDPDGTLRLDQKRDFDGSAQLPASSVVVTGFAGFTCISSQRSVSHRTCRTDSRAA